MLGASGYPGRQGDDVDAAAAAQQGGRARVVVEDDVKDQVVVARVEVVAVNGEGARPDVQLYVALEEPAALVGDDGVEEVRAGGKIAPPAVDDLERLPPARPQGFAGEALSLPEPHELIFTKTAAR